MLTTLLLSTLAIATQTTEVFVAGEDGYHTYRIPAVIQAANGDLLAFCEGRKESRSDAGDIDLVMKRSTDGGATWGAMQLIYDAGPDTIGNPAPVLERASGDILLLLTRNAGDAKEHQILLGQAPRRTVWLMRSPDHGATWTEPREITAQASRPDWRWYATGPGNGIQLEDGTIVIPCNHSLKVDRDTWNSHVIRSTDGGATWSIGGLHDGRVNESAVVQLGDGRLYQNMRNYQGTARRAVSWSDDGGLSWSEDRDDPALIEPVCQASAIAFPLERAADGVAVAFSNPAHEENRERMTVRLSLDGAATWPRELLIHAGPAAYSSLVALDADTLGLLYEAGDDHPYEIIRFTRVPIVALFGARALQR
mgnify:CR=1 FL=1